MRLKSEVIGHRYPTKVGARDPVFDRSMVRMTADQIHLLRKSFAQVEPQSRVAALVFYRRLFALDPRLRPLFKSNIEEQADKLMEMLAVALSLTERLEVLEAELLKLGARHTVYGVRDEHYITVGTAMLDMLSEVLGNDFTPPIRQAWSDFYTFTADTMKRGGRGTAKNRTSMNPVAQR